MARIPLPITKKKGGHSPPQPTPDQKPPDVTANLLEGFPAIERFITQLLANVEQGVPGTSKPTHVAWFDFTAAAQVVAWQPPGDIAIVAMCAIGDALVSVNGIQLTQTHLVTGVRDGVIAWLNNQNPAVFGINFPIINGAKVFVATSSAGGSMSLFYVPFTST